MYLGGGAEGRVLVEHLFDEILKSRRAYGELLEERGQEAVNDLEAFAGFDRLHGHALAGAEGVQDAAEGPDVSLGAELGGSALTLHHAPDLGGESSGRSSELEGVSLLEELGKTCFKLF